MTEESFAVSRASVDSAPGSDAIAELFADYAYGQYQADWSLPREGARVVKVEVLTSQASSVTFCATSSGILGADSRAQGRGISLFRGAMGHVATDSELVGSRFSHRSLKSFNLHNKLGFWGTSLSSTSRRWL